MGKRTQGVERNGRVVDRRDALKLGAGFATFAAFAAGCGSEGTTESATSPASPDAGAADAAPSVTTTPTVPANTGVPAGDAGVRDGAAPAPAPKTAKELLATIDTIVVLMMENRSFDHMLGKLFGDPIYPGGAIVRGLGGGESNPDSSGKPVGVFKLDKFNPPDPPHSWAACHAQWNEGKNDGFVRAHAGAAERDVMGWHDRSQIPFMYWLADNFTVCDAWFSSVMGPTWPNRYYLHAGSSAGQKGNSPLNGGRLTTLWDELKAKGIPAKNYMAGAVAWFMGGFPGKLLTNNPIASFDTFFADAKQGTLPAFSIIDPDFTANDDHPSHDVRRGQALMASIYAALAASPQWKKCLFVITYDEHGGFFDHVPPPTCKDAEAEFRQLGFRVPSLVIGPTVRRGAVLSTQLEHASIAATVALKFGLASFGERVDNASDFSGALDPAKVDGPADPAPTPPAIVVPSNRLWLSTPEVSSQPLLEEMVRTGAIPRRFVDPRSREERLESWIRHAEGLGAVRRI